ncbi:hypothetical protein [Lysobacter panacisoli]|nr:hypothetical protein [Lysobacter panacisoli]
MIIRAVAVWSLGKVALSIPGMLIAVRESPSSGFGPGWLLASIGLEVLIIAALWLFADKLAKLALTRPQEVAFESSMDPATWLGLLLSAIGAWFFFGGVVTAFYMAVRWFVVIRMYREYGAMDADTFANIASTVLEIGLGALLVLRGQGLSRWIHRMRYGVEQAPAEPTA